MAGRPKLPLDERVKTKNITVDADLVEKIGALADSLEEKFGFRPTISQTLRHLIKTGGTA